MHTILKTCLVNLAWILFFLFVVTSSAQARNEYLNDGTNTCDQGSWEAYTEVRQYEYKSGSSAESQNQTLGLRFRKSIGAVCDEEFAEEQRKKQKTCRRSHRLRSLRFAWRPRRGPTRRSQSGANQHQNGNRVTKPENYGFKASKQARNTSFGGFGSQT